MSYVITFKKHCELAGASEEIIEEVAKRMVKDKKIRVDYAKEIIELISKSKNL